MIRQSVTRGLCAVLALGIALPLAAAPKTAAKPAAKANPNATIYCPIMDMDYPKAKATKSSYKGKTYYFCCKKCKQIFDKDPQKEAAKYNAGVAKHNKEKKS